MTLKTLEEFLKDDELENFYNLAALMKRPLLFFRGISGDAKAIIIYGKVSHEGIDAVITKEGAGWYNLSDPKSGNLIHKGTKKGTLKHMATVLNEFLELAGIDRVREVLSRDYESQDTLRAEYIQHHNIETGDSL